MTKRALIAIDVDDVLAAERDAIRTYINEAHGLQLTPQDYAVEGQYWGYWEQVWGVDGETGRQWYKGYLDAGVKRQLQAVDGAIDAIMHLKEHYNLAVITSREDSTFDVTHEWLNMHFPEAFKHVEFVTLWDKDRKVSKAAICDHLGASYLIDDNVEHCNLAAEAGVQALLFGEYGWSNSSEHHPGVRRVKDWVAVKDYFDGKS